jgi:DNA-binding protein H-NS
MARTYRQIQGQIAKLQGNADKLRRGEVAGVVARIKEAIAVYGLTAADLFGGRVGGTRKAYAKSLESPPDSAADKAPTKSRSKLGAKAKFADGAGHEWVGRGPRPLWLRDALSAGHDLSEFAVAARAKGKPSATSGAAKPVTSKMKTKPGKARSVAIKYRDAAGNIWSGRGSRPRWLKAALAAGRSIEQFLV